MPLNRDRALVWDMPDAARKIHILMVGISPARYAEDFRTHYAVERLLLIIGEATRHVDHDLRQLHPEVPWAALIGQRNVLAHEYGEVLLQKVYEAVNSRLPSLICQLAIVLAELDPA